MLHCQATLILVCCKISPPAHVIYSVNVININGLVILSLFFGDICLSYAFTSILCVDIKLALFLLLLYVAIIYQTLVCSCYLY